MDKQVKANESNVSMDEMHHLFVVLARQFGLLQKESSQCCGVTTVQSHILYEIKHAHHLSLNDLADRLDLDSSTTSRHVQGLVEKEYVQRQPHPKDRRFITLGLTEQGIKLEREIRDMMTVYIEDILNQLPEGRGHKMTSELKMLIKAMSNSKYCCRPPFM